MDNLTHSLVGLFLARAGLKRFSVYGTGLMVLAANAPDMDAVSLFAGPASYIHWHRNLTHSLFAVPLMALLSVSIVRTIGRRKLRWIPAFLIATAAVASHLILDLTNVYGVRLLLPFSGRWFHWDLTPVIDLGIWAMLLIGIVAPALGRLVASEIGESRRGSGALSAISALVLLTLYDSGRGFLHNRARAMLDSRTLKGGIPLRTGAFPEQNPLIWTDIAEFDDSYVEIPVDLHERLHPEMFLTFYKAQRDGAVLAAMATEPFQRFLEFVQYPIWVREPAPDLPDAIRASLVDMRFGTPMAPGFEAVATVDSNHRVVRTTLTFGGLKAR